VSPRLAGLAVLALLLGLLAARGLRRAERS